SRLFRPLLYQLSYLGEGLILLGIRSVRPDRNGAMVWEDYLRSGAQWSPRVSTTTSRPLLTIGVSKRRHHCPSQTIAQSRTAGFQGMYVSRTRNTAAGTTRAASRRR